MDRLTWDGYAAAWARSHGGCDPRRAGLLVRGWLRLGFRLGSALGRLDLAPSVVTTAGLVLCLLVPPVAGSGGGWPMLAALLVLLAALADTVDGAVALATGRVTRTGAVYDAVADRVGEACWVAAFWVLGAPGPLVVACGAAGWLHEYMRARAVGIPYAATIGERPTRVSVAVVGLLLAGAAGPVSADLAAGTVTVVAAGWLLLGVFGLSQLAGTVRRSITYS